MSKKDEIIMGAGELYMMIFNSGTIPTNEEIETEKNNVGHCQGGFSIDYKPEVYDVKNQFKTIVRRFTIGEEITTKTGILTWDLGRLAMLSTAQFVVDAAKKVRKLIFGGKNPLATVLVRFVHTKENGKKKRKLHNDTKGRSASSGSPFSCSKSTKGKRIGKYDTAFDLPAIPHCPAAGASVLQ